MNFTAYLIPEDYAIIAITFVIYLLHYIWYKKAMNDYTSLICEGVKDNGQLYTPEVRHFIQQTIEQCGVSAPVTAISGWKAGEHGELISFAILPSNDGIFYLNIPFGWVSFLRDLLTRMNNNEQPSEEESRKLNSFIWVIHHEMNQVKTIIAGRSPFARSYPWTRNGVALLLMAVLLMYAAHLGFFRAVYFYIEAGMYGALLPIMVGMVLGGFIGYLGAITITAFAVCRRVCVWDVEGIESVSVLRGGVDWLLHDAKAYVDGIFDGRLRFLRFLYRAFPNALCSLFTHHPHPIVRAAAIEKKIAALQAQG